MYCIILGLNPYLDNLWEKVQEVQFHDSIKILWKEHSSAVDDGRLTFLASAWSEVSPSTLCDVVGGHLNELGVTCEMWASSPAPLPLRPKEGYDEQVRDDGAFSVVVMGGGGPSTRQTMKQWGILTQRSILVPEQVRNLRKMIDKAIQTVEESIRAHRPDIRIGQDEILFREIASRNLERFDLKLSDPEILTFVAERIQADQQAGMVLEQILGSSHEVDFDVSVVYSRPGACAQNWHADGAHQHGASDAGWRDDGWRTSLADPYAVCLFVPLIDLNTKVGFTQFWPGSHRSRNLVGFGQVAELTQATFNGICQAGDGIWYDYRLLHRGMPNQSTCLRPVLQVVFKKKWYVERENYGTEPIAP